MCTTLPETLITVMGIEKVVAEWRDLARVAPAAAPLRDRGADEPVHVALDRRARGRRAVRVPPRAPRRRQDARARRPGGAAGAPLHPLLGLRQRLPGLPADRGARLSARSTPGRSARSSQPQLAGERGAAASLPYASSLCGACADVCPVGIDIPRILVHERAKVVRRTRPGLEGARCGCSARAFSSAERYERAQRTARALQRPALRDGRLRWLAGPARGLGALAHAARRRGADVPRVVGDA